MVEMRASSSIMKFRSPQAVHEQVQRRTAFLLWFLIEEQDFYQLHSSLNEHRLALHFKMDNIIWNCNVRI